MGLEPIVDYMGNTGRWWELDIFAEVAQAVGMAAAQLDCPPQDAATILRAHAAAHAQDAVEVALDIVYQQLTFTP